MKKIMILKRNKIFLENCFKTLYNKNKKERNYGKEKN